MGSDGPYAGTRHEFMVLGQRRLAVPSNKEYSVGQIQMMLTEVAAILGRKLTAEQWVALS